MPDSGRRCASLPVLCARKREDNPRATPARQHCHLSAARLPLPWHMGCGTARRGVAGRCRSVCLARGTGRSVVEGGGSKPRRGDVVVGPGGRGCGGTLARSQSRRGRRRTSRTRTPRRGSWSNRSGSARSCRFWRGPDGPSKRRNVRGRQRSGGQRAGDGRPREQEALTESREDRTRARSAGRSTSSSGSKSCQPAEKDETLQEGTTGVTPLPGGRHGVEGRGGYPPAPGGRHATTSGGRSRDRTSEGG